MGGTAATWTETESGASISLNGVELVPLHPVDIPVEQRLQPVNPPEDIDVKTRLKKAGTVDAAIPADLKAALDTWLRQRWSDAVDTWMVPRGAPAC